MLHYFNPGHEAAVLNGSPYYMPPANVQRMQEELAFLPAWYGAAGDGVLVPGGFDGEYYRRMRALFPGLPRPVGVDGLGEGTASPWGVSPQAIHLLEEAAGRQGIRLALPAWRDEYRYLNSRASARDCLTGLLRDIPGVEDGLLPRPCTSLDEVEALVRHSIRPLLAKAPYSSSGRGLLWLPVGDLPAKTAEMLGGMLRRQGAVYVEEVLDKDTDFSMQFLCDGRGGVTFGGYSLFETSGRGAYTGNLLYGQREIASLLESKVTAMRLEAVKRELAGFFRRQCAGFYAGCVGVDMLVYRRGGQYRLHPCLEINMRYNMGWLSLRLQQDYLAPGTEGRFALGYHAGGALGEHLRLEREHPLRTSGGRVTAGYLPLCPVGARTKYLAYVLAR